MIDCSKLNMSLSQLQAQFENYESLDASLPKLIQEAVAESVIQRFETCWDCLWKVLKRYLNEELGLPEIPNSPKPILRLANENNLLAADIDRWLSYASARIDTAHDYSGEKAQQALKQMGTFVSDAIALYQTMSGEPWEK